MERCLLWPPVGLTGWIRLTVRGISGKTPLFGCGGGGSFWWIGVLISCDTGDSLGSNLFWLEGLVVLPTPWFSSALFFNAAMDEARDWMLAMIYLKLAWFCTRSVPLDRY